MKGELICSTAYYSTSKYSISIAFTLCRYVQFSEYLGFVKTMDEFRGMKLVRKDGDKNLAINITMDFDTTKHLSESNIKRRKILRDRLIAKEQVRREEEMKRQQEEEAAKEKERFDSMQFNCVFIYFLLSHDLI